MSRRRMSLLVLCVGISRLTAQTAGVDRLIQEAFEKNREVLAAQQRVAEARALVGQAGVRPVPTVEVNAGSGKPLGTAGEAEYTLGYVQPIETAGKRSKRVLVAERALELASAELAERRRQLAYDIKSAYIEAIRHQRKAGALDEIVNVNREAYRLVDARVQRDDAAPLERQLLLVESNRTEAQRAATSGQAQAARLELRRAMGVANETGAAGQFQQTQPLDVTATLDEVRRRALETRPDLQVARTLAAGSSAELALIEAQSRPDLTISAQYARRYSQLEDPIRTTASGSPLPIHDRDNLLTAGISIPLQTRRRNQGSIEAAVARQRAAELRRQHLEVTIPLEVEAAWQRYQAAKNTVAILNRGVVDESRRNLSVIRQAYNLGQLRLLDVLNEQRRLLETELSYIDAEAELARSEAELERTAGGNLK